MDQKRQRGRLKRPSAADIARLREILRRRESQSDADRLTEVLDGIRQQAEHRLEKLRGNADVWKVFLQVDLDTFGPPGFTYDPQELRQRLGAALPVRREAETAAVASAGARATHNPARMFTVGYHVGQNDILEALPRHERVLVLRRLKQARSALAARGGRAPKRLPGIWQRVLDLVRDNPQITTPQVWTSFPKDEPGGHEGEGPIYLSVGRNKKGDLVPVLIEVDDHTAKERTMSYDSLRGYLKAARKQQAEQ